MGKSWVNGRVLIPFAPSCKRQDKQRNWPLSGELTNLCPKGAQREEGGTTRYHAYPWGRCGTANMEESMMYPDVSMMYPGSI